MKYNSKTTKYCNNTFDFVRYILEYNAYRVLYIILLCGENTMGIDNKVMNSLKTEKQSNTWLLAMLFCLPKGILSSRTDFCNVSRRPYDSIHGNQYNDLVDNPHFADYIKKAYAEAVWKHLQIPKKGRHVRMDTPMSDFSENFGLWQLVYSAVDYVREILEETEYSLQKLASMPENVEVPWMSEADFDKLMEGITDRIVWEQGWQPIIDYVWQNRTPEDYSAKNSRKKTDTHRQWHHSRTEVGAKMISIEAAQEQAEANGGGFDISNKFADPAEIIERAEDFEDEDDEYHGSGQDGDYDIWLAGKIRQQKRLFSPCFELLNTHFGRALCHEDRQLLAMRNEECIFKELAKVQNFNAHTGVINRLKHIEECYDSGKPVSPRRNKLVPDELQIRRKERQVTIFLSDSGQRLGVYLCSPRAFTLCRNCLKKIDAGKRDFCCPVYMKNGICAASNLSYIYFLHSRPRKMRNRTAKDIMDFVAPPV